MSTRPLVDDEHFVVSLPPPGPAVVLDRPAAAIDLAFTLQPADGALVALCDDHRHVLLVVTTTADRVGLVPELAGELDAVSTAMVVTAHPGRGDPIDAALAAHRWLEARFDAVGIRLLDWLQVDDRRARSLAARRPG